MSNANQRTVKTTCPYCGVGCGVLATPKPDGSLDIKGDPDHPANFGRLCSKGSALGETVGLEGRLLHPEVNGEQTGWDQALDLVATTFSETIRDHGPDSVAFYVSGQILTEDYYVANKLMKGFIGSANIDTNSRLCMASSVAGHRKAFGTDTVPGTYEDLELADVIVLVGSNLAWCHPVLYQRIEAAKQARPEMKVVLIDPRRTMTANLADLHLTIAPDGDAALFTGLLAHLAENGKIDSDYIRRHTTGFDDCLTRAKALAGPEVLKQTGLSASEIGKFYSLFANTEKVVTVYSQGVNQSVSGTDKVSTILNCHLATARIGKPGMGPFSVTGQPNAMGGREVGGLANMLACHMDIENPEHRDLVQEFWQSPNMPDKPGLKAVDMYKAVADGRIKAIWIMSTNPVDSLPEADTVAAALDACPFVVVSDIVTDTDTMQYAHVKLPAAAWGEKSGTVTNSERRISRQRQFSLWPGEARPDWWQLVEVGKRMGFKDAFDYSRPSQIFDEYAKLSGLENDDTRDFNIDGMSGLSEEEYDALAPVQWPQVSSDALSDTRFFANGKFFTPDRKARFICVTPKVEAITDDAHSFVLNTGRIRDHWHTMTRTALSERLSSHLAEPFCEIHPVDAKELGVSPATLVELSNSLGTAQLRALVTDRVPQGSLFAPMHWTNQFASNARVDKLVPAITDPFSGQPASKNVAVAIRPFQVAAFAFLVSREKPDLSNGGVTYWATAKCTNGWRTELAFSSMRDALMFAEKLEDGLGGSNFLDFNDPISGEHRIAGFNGTRLSFACYLSSEPVFLSREWLIEQLSADFASPVSRQSVLAGRADAGRPDKGPIICSCMSVGANEILSSIHAGAASAQRVGEITTAGTNCGSCRAEISGMIDEHLHETRIAAE
ncbi:MAG: nitrate reductase [Rhizobiaceae bacterium]|nr:nitrate reductase [Rhizobiaceae bacterium]